MQVEEEIPLGSSKKEKKEKKPVKKKQVTNVLSSNGDADTARVIKDDPMNVAPIEPHIKRGDESNKLFICTNFYTPYPLKPSALVVAPSKELARRVLVEGLETNGNAALKPKDATHQYAFQEVDLNIPRAFILSDGDYAPLRTFRNE